MKKFGFLAMLLIGLVTLAACGPRGDDVIRADEDNQYFAMGQFAEWSPQEQFELEAIATNDDRVSSILSDIVDAEYLYIVEVTFSAEDAGWSNTFTEDGDEVTFNGNQAVKVMRLDAEDAQTWMPSPEGGEIRNLTPDALFMPNFVDPDGDDYEEGLGHWNDNPFVREPGTYYIIYARVNNQNYMGAIPVE